jgi:F-type H+-transporting ATPase subunit a
MSLGIFDHHTIQPFAIFGLTDRAWDINIDILIGTWVAMFLLFVVVMVGRYSLTKERSLIVIAYEKIITFFMDLVRDSMGSFTYYPFAFVVAIFCFTFFSCLVGVIPYIEESTRDINTTLALALTSFVYIQYQKIKAHGLLGFLKEFIEPSVVLLPMHIVGELSKIASMSFRLFGNVLGGSVILGMIINLVGDYRVYFLPFLYSILLAVAVAAFLRRFKSVRTITPLLTIMLNMLFVLTWLQMVLGIAEGLIQSFVLTMLTLTYLAMGTATHTDEKEHA